MATTMYQGFSSQIRLTNHHDHLHERLVRRRKWTPARTTAPAPTASSALGSGTATGVFATFSKANELTVAWFGVPTT